MKLSTIILAAAITIGSVGCSRMDTMIPQDMATWSTDLAPALKSLTDEDRALVANYLMRAKLGEVFGGKGVPIGTTIGDAIKMQKKFLGEQAAQQAAAEALKAKVKAEQMAAAEALSKLVNARFMSKQETPRDHKADDFAHRYSEFQTILINVENKSAKAITGVLGTLWFVDIFGRDVGKVGVTINETIAPSGSVVWVGERKYNGFSDDQRAIWALQDGQYTTRFIPTMVVFADGTKVGTAS